MKLKQFLLVVIAIIGTASCHKPADSPYVVQTCTGIPNEYRFVDVKTLPYNNNDKNWTVVSYDKDADWVMFKYTGEPFRDLCVKEVNGLKAEIKGRYTSVTAFVKVTDKDSFEIKLTNKEPDAQGVIQWTGEYNQLDLEPYYMHYPGRIWPVVYIKLPYTYVHDDRGFAYEELRKNFYGFWFNPTGKKF